MAKRYVWMPKDSSTVIDGKPINHGDVVSEKSLSKQTLDAWVDQGLLGHELVTEGDVKSISVAVNDQVAGLLKEAEKKISDLSIMNEAVITDNDILKAENDVLKAEVEALKAHVTSNVSTGEDVASNGSTGEKDNPLAPAGKK